MRHYNLALALVLFSALALCQVRAVDIPTIPDFHVVVGLPEEMVAGSTYQTSFTYVKPNHKEAELNISIEITENQSIIGFEEFHVEGKLDMWTAHPRGHETVEMDFTETSGGVFQFQRLIEEVSFNCVTVSITSAPNLMPGTYTFTLTVTLQYD